jgi:hypothetical protein
MSSYIATDGLSPVRLGAHDQILAPLFDKYFLFFSCMAPSLTRGRVCNLQCNDANSMSSYIATGGLSPVRLGAQDQILTPLFDKYFLSFSCMAPSLTRGRVCNLQCNDASSISSYTPTGGLSASSSWCRAPNGAHDQILISLFDSYFNSSR